MDNLLLHDDKKRKHLESVSKEDNPEHMDLPSEVITDQYSSEIVSAEQKQTKGSRKRLKNTHSHFFVKALYSSSNVPIKTLKNYFNLEFCSIPKGPTPEELRKLCVTDILNHLIYFVTNLNDVSAHQLIEELKTSTKHSDWIMEFYEQTDYAVNLKECGMLPDTNQCKGNGKADIFIREFMTNLMKVLRTPEFRSSKTEEYHHDMVKRCFESYARLTLETIIGNGEAIHVIKVKRPVSLHPCETRSRKVEKPFEEFVSHPDLVLGGSKLCPKIPVEVYCPLKTYIECGDEEKDTSPVGACHLPETDKAETEEQVDQNFLKFLTENTPCYMCEQSGSKQSQFKINLASQLVLQTISSAVEYSFHKAFQPCGSGEWKKDRVFIGLFVGNEYVYMSRIIGDELNFAKIPKEIPKRDEVENESRPIYVQFSPLVLDLSIHNHRIALILFMKYYMCYWVNIKTQFVVEEEEDGPTQ